MMKSFQKLKLRRGVLKSTPGEQAELQNMLVSVVSNHKQDAQKPDSTGGVCLMTESPFRILRVRIIVVFINFIYSNTN